MIADQHKHVPHCDT